jgi:hypothetical protein
MHTWLMRFAVLLVGLGIATAQTKQAAKTDAEIKRSPPTCGWVNSLRRRQRPRVISKRVSKRATTF